MHEEMKGRNQQNETSQKPRKDGVSKEGGCVWRILFRATKRSYYLPFSHSLILLLIQYFCFQVPSIDVQGTEMTRQNLLLHST
jgi:hypothetical protein